MGTWGVGITANDDFLDIKAMFFDCYFYGTLSVAEIENSIITYSKDGMSVDGGEWHNVYFAIALCEWKCGCLSDAILRKVEQIISEGKDIEYWKELGATEGHCRQREKALQKFLTQIKSVNAKPIKRRLKKRFEMPLKTGDVFACYSKANGYYGCGVALRVFESPLKPWEEEYNFYAVFAISALTSEKLPTAEQVVNANVKDVFWNGGCIGYNLPKKGFVVLGNVAESIDVDYAQFRGDFYRGSYNRLAVYLRNSGRPSFDGLVSHELYRLQTLCDCPVSDKPMTFLFCERDIIKLSD